MQNVIDIWTSLNLRRRVIIVGATLAMFAAILGLSRMAGRAEMGLLYAGLEPAAAGEVVAALDQRGVAFEVRGESIFVDVTQRDALRMALASEGLPAAGGGGYELLDSLSGFGTTSQMFDAAYWRAKEGEIARTLLAMPEVKAARVGLNVQEVPVPYRRRFSGRSKVSSTLRGTVGAGAKILYTLLRHATVPRSNALPAQLNRPTELTFCCAPRCSFRSRTVPSDIFVLRSPYQAIQVATGWYCEPAAADVNV